MGAINFCYFIFFIIGTLTKKHFNRIELTLDKTETISILIILYFTLNIFGGPLKYMAGIGRIFELILNISGVFIVFSFFRKFEYIFTKNTYFANILKFIGKRTLDIYLLHYFFISYNLPEIFPYFKNNNLPLIEFTCSIIMAVLIIIACLTISSIIRLSPTLGHFLFGAKK